MVRRTRRKNYLRSTMENEHPQLPHRTTRNSTRRSQPHRRHLHHLHPPLRNHRLDLGTIPRHAILQYHTRHHQPRRLLHLRIPKTPPKTKIPTLNIHSVPQKH